MDPAQRKRLESVRKAAVKQGVLFHDVDAGAPCLKCGDACVGFELHYWRKICKNCRCKREEHDIKAEENAETKRMIKNLFSDNPSPVVPRKTEQETIELDARFAWTPNVGKDLAVKYMEALPEDKVPVKGTDGQKYRRDQLFNQLPVHDNDVTQCDNLTDAEREQMHEFVLKRKKTAIGRASVKDRRPMMESDGWTCAECRKGLESGSVAVFADRAGDDRCWHPGCFVCSKCKELLVDLIYFWHGDKLYCGRHHAELVKPRCAACDELIFSKEYTRAEDKNWHLRHFCCFECDVQLGGKRYVSHENHPYCLDCFDRRFSKVCQSCGNAIPADAPHLTHGEQNWHGTEQCFRCSQCSKSLVGQKFLPKNGKIFCSKACWKKSNDR
uniref:Prickle/testin-like protein n=1 Tax=Oscarella lobularis TaxID=121494 RepID=A0A142F4Z3_OSCLO|nr:prickle/testin-like protein [Oscarella lobularis]